MRSAMKPFGYLILFYFGKYLFTILIHSIRNKHTLFTAFAFEILESEGTSADLHD